MRSLTRIRLRSLSTVLVAGFVVSACSPTTSESSTTTALTATTTTTVGMTTTEMPATTSTTAIPRTTTTVRPARAFYDRQCGSRISEGYGAPGSDIPILNIGPVALLAFDPVWLATQIDYYATPDDEGRYHPIKYVLVVNHEAVGPVRVSIPEPDRDQVRLVYDPALSHPYPMWEEADHTVKFGVCSDVDAQYNGGIVISGPGCAQIVVIDEGVEGSEWTASLPIGVPMSDCNSG